jgi:hypothetical protein
MLARRNITVRCCIVKDECAYSSPAVTRTDIDFAAAQIGLTELVRRLENPRLLADPPPYRPNALLRGPRQLRVAIDGVRA